MIKIPKLPRLKVDAKEVTKSFYHKAAPGLLTGFMSGKLKGVPPLTAHEWLKNNDLWEMIPEDRKPFLLGARPWGLSEWFTLDWLYQAFKKCNPPLATMLAASPKFRERMQSQLVTLIEILDKTDSQ